MNIEREKSEYEGAGIGMDIILIFFKKLYFEKNIEIFFKYDFLSILFLELMDLCEPAKLKKFISWDGDSINLQHFKLDRISRKYLDNLEQNMKMESDH